MNNQTSNIKSLHKIVGEKPADIVSNSGAFRISPSLYRLLVLLAIIAYTAIYSTGYLRPLVLALGVFLAFMLLLGRSFFYRPSLVQFCSIIVMLYSLKAYYGPLPGIIVLLEFTSVILFLQLQVTVNARSAGGVILLTLMIILAVAAMNVNFIFPLCLVPYLLVAFTVLHQIVCLRHQKICMRQMQPCCGLIMLRRLLRRAVFFTPIFIIFWMSLFYLIPRYPSYGLASETSRRRLKGFNETLALGEGGLLEDNPAVVMRVKPSDRKTFSPSIIRRLRGKLLRGTSFTTYFKGRWDRNRPRRYFIDLRRSVGQLEIIKNLPPQKKLHQLEIILENTEPPVIFLPDQTVSAEFDASFIGMEKDKSLYFLGKSSSRRRYLTRVLINPLTVRDAPVESIDVTGSMRLYLSRVGIDARIAKLASRIASGSATINQRVQAVMNYLKQNYNYSLYESLAGSEDPVTQFLFTSQSGSCEHFASAMTLMLRALRIPARPVNGYTMGDWNETGGFFTVRQRHAHSWVEVYFPENGWVPFDPSPPAENDEPEGEIEKLFAQLWELYEGYWFTFVYNFDHQVQIFGFKRIVSSLEKTFSSFKGFFIGFESWIIVILIFLFVFYKLFTRSKIRRSTWIPGWYLAWAESMDVKRNSWETPSEFHERLVDSGIFSNDYRRKLAFLAYLVDRNAIKGEDQEKIKEQALELLSKLRETG
jgi:transglutaminase-like putative cysteine protease